MFAIKIIITYLGLSLFSLPFFAVFCGVEHFVNHPPKKLRRLLYVGLAILVVALILWQI